MAAARPARRHRRHGRLLAACATGALAAGAFALGPAGPAHADSAPQARPAVQPLVQRPVPHPTLTLPHKSTLSSAAPRAAAATPLNTPWFDVDGDGVGDVLTQEADRSILLLPSASTASDPWQNLGQSAVMYKDILTPGDLTASSAGPEVLTLTTTGLLSMWGHASFPGGNATWTGTGWQIYNKVVAVGDIDGNGFGDLLARTPSGDLYLYKGTGNASAPFAARVKVGYGFGIYDQVIGGGDLTASGHETLVARDLSGDLWLYTLDGSQAAPLSARVKIGYGWGVYNQLIGFGDDKGSLGSIYGRDASGTLYFYQGDGAGALTARFQAGNYWTDHLIAGQGSVPLWGKDDLFAQTSGGNLYYYYGTNTGGVSSRILVGSAGDWQGADLVGAVSLSQQDEEPLLQIYQGTLYNNTTGFTDVMSSGWGGYNKVFGPGDLNNDGNADLLARDGSGVLWNITGKGTGYFYNRAKVGAGWGGYNQITGAGDINGDGFADIVARASTGHLYLYLGTGNGLAPFTSRIDIGGGWNTYTKLAAPGDLDGDGRADIVAVTSGGQLYRYSGSGRTGTSTFKPRVEIGTAGWNGYSSLF